MILKCVVLSFRLLFQDSSFVEGKDNASKEFDIEMGHRFTRSQSDSGIDSFNKQVSLY